MRPGILYYCDSCCETYKPTMPINMIQCPKCGCSDVFMRTAPQEQECGVTSVSLQNLADFTTLHGKIDSLDFSGDTKRGDYFVTAHWKDGSAWKFSGFSWGYAGEGPRGLQALLKVFGSQLKPSDIYVNEFGKTQLSLFASEPLPIQHLAPQVEGLTAWGHRRLHLSKLSKTALVVETVKTFPESPLRERFKNWTKTALLTYHSQAPETHQSK